MRKKSEIDFDKYNQLVVADENTVTHEYSSAYRGRIQNRNVDLAFMPMFQLSFSQYDNGVRSYQAYDRDVESFNFKEKPIRKIYVRCNVKTLSEEENKSVFAVIDSLSAAIDASRNIVKNKGLIIQRAVANSVVQNYADAISDLTAYIDIDSTSAIAYWHRAVCQARMNEFEASQGKDIRLLTLNAMSDLDKAIILNSSNPYLYYDRGNLYVIAKDYVKAIDNYTKAIELDANLAEAYYNRGIANIKIKKTTEGIRDLSKAGELGLYNAYSIIKKYSSKK